MRLCIPEEGLQRVGHSCGLLFGKIVDRSVDLLDARVTRVGPQKDLEPIISLTAEPQDRHAQCAIGVEVLDVPAKALIPGTARADRVRRAVGCRIDSAVEG